MFVSECEWLKELHLFDMPWVQLVLLIDVLKGFVIRMQDKWFKLQVIALMSQGPHYGTKFFAIGAVVAC